MCRGRGRLSSLAVSGPPSLPTLTTTTTRERYAPGLLFVLREAQASSATGTGSAGAPVGGPVTGGAAANVGSTPGVEAEAALAALVARTAALLAEEAVAVDDKRGAPLLDPSLA